jgi:hypothetical protein
MPAASAASRRSCSWRGVPTLLKITPATRARESKVANPCRTAAAEAAMPEASMTSATGAASSRATCAVEAKSPPVLSSAVSSLAPPALPSNRPITPSMTAMSAGMGVVAPCRNIGTTWSAPVSQGSRLRPARPAARAW